MRNCSCGRQPIEFMTKHEAQFWKSQEQRKKMDKFLSRLEADMLKASSALRHLKKVTGKLGLSRIDPFNEKRWSRTSKEAWLLLSGISIMIQDGITPEESVERTIKKYKPTAEFCGRHSTAKWLKSSCLDRAMDSVISSTPDLKNKCVKTSSKSASRKLK